jgi:Carboxypeptidase regulatory-like domain
MKRLIVAVVLMFAVGSAVMPAVADTPRGPVQRVVTGRVLDDHDVPVRNAVVYLKDTRTLAVKSYLAAADGTYRFGQLSGTTDYELWAESDGKKSKTRSISSFDTKNEFHIDLKL